MQHNHFRRLSLFVAGAAIFLTAAIGIHLAFASLTFTGTNVNGNGPIVIDGPGTISIGTSSATGVIIGNSSSTVTINGSTLDVASGSITASTILPTNPFTPSSVEYLSALPLANCIYDLQMLEGSGATTANACGAKDTIAFPGGSAAPTWTSGGLAFSGANTTHLQLSSAANTARTFIFRVYIPTPGENGYPNQSTLSASQSLLTNQASSGGAGVTIGTYGTGNGGVWIPAIIASNGSTVTKTYCGSDYNGSVVAGGWNTLAFQLGSVSDGTYDRIWINGQQCAT